MYLIGSLNKYDHVGDIRVAINRNPETWVSSCVCLSDKLKYCFSTSSMFVRMKEASEWTGFILK